jgi:IS1 family transposase
MNVLAQETQIIIVKALVEGTSIRSIDRVTGVHRDTIMRLELLAGTSCANLLDQKVLDIEPKRLQLDEIWTFVFKKQARISDEDHPSLGDQYVWMALDPETKLVVTHYVGKRDAASALYFIADLKERIKGRPQITTDRFKPYISAIEDCFGADVDYAQLVKVYGQGKFNDGSRDWYAPVQVTAAIPKPISRRPDARHISTSLVERQNLMMRMQMRRFTRLTNGFSKKLENLKAAIALHYGWYNFVRVHSSLRVTPAMAAGLTDRIWEFEEFLSF